MKHAVVVFALVLVAAVYVFACGGLSRRFGASPGYANPTKDRFVYASGTSGTYTVPTGFAVTSVWAHNTSGGGTLTIAPSGPAQFSTCASWDAGPDLYDAAADTGPDPYDAAPLTNCRAAGNTIVIPALTDWELRIPTLTGGPDQLGAGTVFVFTSTDSYVITMLDGS